MRPAQWSKRSPWNNQRSGRFLEGILVFGGALRDDEHLAIATFSDTHRLDSIHFSNRHVNQPAVARIHRIERDRSSSVLRTLHRSIREPVERLFSLVSTTFDVYHDSRGVFALSHRDLVRHELQCVGRPTIATLEGLGSRSSKLEDQIIAFRRLRDFEGAKLHPLNRTEQELSEFSNLSRRSPLRFRDGCLDFRFKNFSGCGAAVFTLRFSTSTLASIITSIVAVIPAASAATLLSTTAITAAFSALTLRVPSGTPIAATGFFPL